MLNLTPERVTDALDFILEALIFASGHQPKKQVVSSIGNELALLQCVLREYEARPIWTRLTSGSTIASVDKGPRGASS